MNKNIISPCISICKTDPLTGFCYGCGRTNEDKVIWKDPDTLNSWKESNLLTLRERLTGWQKNAFERSYSSKKKTGMSLLKRKLIKSKS
jgi:uncharacterized protein